MSKSQEIIAYDFGYITTEQLVERINGAPVFGFDDHTPEFLAAAYAADGYSPSEQFYNDSVRYDLEQLQLAGAEFDIDQACEMACFAIAETEIEGAGA